MHTGARITRTYSRTHTHRTVRLWRVRSHLPTPFTHTHTHTHQHPPTQPPSSRAEPTITLLCTVGKPIKGLPCVYACVCVCVYSWANKHIPKKQKRISKHTHASEHSPPPSLQIHVGTNCHTWRFDIPASASRRMRGGNESGGGGWRRKGWGTTEREKKRMDGGGDDDNPFSPQQRRIIYLKKKINKNSPLPLDHARSAWPRPLMDAASSWSHSACWLPHIIGWRGSPWR